MREELVSVILPTYNVEEYVEEAVLSVLQQDYKTIEVIIIDDCSSDKTYQILKGLKKKDKRIRLFRNNKNMGIVSALNTALDYSRGSYIVRMDGDDVCDCSRIRVLKEFLDTHEDYSIVGSYVININDNSSEISRRRMIRTYNFAQIGILFQTPILHIWMARKKTYKILNGYRDVPYAEDYDFLLRAYNKGIRFGNVPYYLYSVRWREGNTATSKGVIQKKAMMSIRKICKEEGRKGREIYNRTSFDKLIRANSFQMSSYIRGYKFLLKAISSKNTIAKCLKYAALAFFSSKYIALHMIESMIIRLIVKVEDLRLSKTNEMSH